MRRSKNLFAGFLLLASFQAGIAQDISTPDYTHPGTLGLCRTYVKYGCGNSSGQVKRPFFIVEGIDLGKPEEDDHDIDESIQWGSFGWSTLVSGVNNQYRNVANLQVLLKKLHAEGWDILLVDFMAGNAGVSENGLLLKQEIKWVNEQLAQLPANEQTDITLFSISMGGMTSRWALGNMEYVDSEVDHNVGLWFTMDTPHKGANIPIGNQAALKLMDGIYDIFGLSGETNEKLDHFEEVMTSKAAQDMMISNISYCGGQAPSFAALQSDPSFQMPSQPMCVAISNGNGKGQKLGLNDNSTMLNVDLNKNLLHYKYDGVFIDFERNLDINVDFLTRSVKANADVEVMKLRASFDWDGHADGVVESVTNSLIDMVSNRFLGHIDCLSSVDVSSGITVDVRSVRSYDNAPGSYGFSSAQMAKMMATNDNGAVVRPEIIENSNPLECYIPTVSSLGINLDMYTNIDATFGAFKGQLIPEGLKSLCEFDVIYYPEVSERHTDFTYDNTNFIYSFLSPQGERYKWRNGDAHTIKSRDELTLGDAGAAIDVEGGERLNAYAQQNVVIAGNFVVESGANLLITPNQSLGFCSDNLSFQNFGGGAGVPFVEFEEEKEEEAALGFDAEEILLYPNPTFGVFHIRVNEDEMELQQVEIFDPAGRMIVSKAWVEGGISFNLEEQPRGIYITRMITTDGQVHLHKVINQ